MTILAIDIGGTSVKIGIVNNQGEISQFNEIPSHSQRGAKALIDRLILFIRENYEGYRAIGISTAGQVDSEKGKIIYANDNIPGYTGMNLQDIFYESFHLPIKVENDVNAAALGELHFGSGRQYKDFICLTYGTGVGGAIVMNNQLYKGFTGNAAEFGHMNTHPEGKTCTCGRNGCYEMYASTRTLVENAQKHSIRYNSGREIFKAFKREDDAKLKSIVYHWIQEIAYGLVSLIHIFNPPAVIIGGGIMEQSVLLSLIRTEVKAQIMPSFSSVVISSASLGNKAGLLGVASLHIE